MSIQSESQGEVFVIRVQTKRLDELSGILSEGLSAGFRRIVVDFSGIPAILGEALEKLGEAFLACHAQGGVMVLSGLTPEMEVRTDLIAFILEQEGIALTTFPDVDAAVASLSEEAIGDEPEDMELSFDEGEDGDGQLSVSLEEDSDDELELELESDPVLEPLADDPVDAFETDPDLEPVFEGEPEADLELDFETDVLAETVHDYETPPARKPVGKNDRVRGFEAVPADTPQVDDGEPEFRVIRIETPTLTRVGPALDISDLDELDLAVGPLDPSELRPSRLRKRSGLVLDRDRLIQKIRAKEEEQTGSGAGA